MEAGGVFVDVAKAARQARAVAGMLVAAFQILEDAQQHLLDRTERCAHPAVGDVVDDLLATVERGRGIFFALVAQ